VLAGVNKYLQWETYDTEIDKAVADFYFWQSLQISAVPKIYQH